MQGRCREMQGDIGEIQALLLLLQPSEG